MTSPIKKFLPTWSLIVCFASTFAGATNGEPIIKLPLPPPNIATGYLEKKVITGSLLGGIEAKIYQTINDSNLVIVSNAREDLIQILSIHSIQFQLTGERHIQIFVNMSQSENLMKILRFTEYE